MRMQRRAQAGACFAALAALVAPLNSAVASPVPSANLVLNSGFEAGTASWYAERGSALSRVQGYEGRYAARVTAVTAGTAAINDAPDTVQSSTEESTYTATAYVRTTTPGTTVSVRLQEYSGTTVHGRAERSVKLADRSWRKVSVTYVAKTTGARVGLTVTGDPLASGRSFEVDAVSLRSTAATPVVSSFTAAPGTPAYGQVTLAWAARSAARYEVYRQGATAPVYSGTAATVSLSSAASTTSTYTLRAIGADGTVISSAPVSVTTAARPPAITSFTVKQGTPAYGSFALAWTASDAVRYEVLRSGVSTPVYSGTQTSVALADSAQTTATFTLRAVGADGTVVSSAPVTATTAAQPGPTWSRVYRHDFADLTDVSAFQSSKTVNDQILPTDTTNSQLQKPSLKSNVQAVADAGADDGKAMGVYTRKGTYATSSGTAQGWSNGRMALVGHNEAPPVRIRTRLRMTASAKAKTAVMWWPAGGGWPWEVDFAETFGGSTTTDYWGSRQFVAQRWHADLNGDGMAKEQLLHDDAIDATKYHVYDLFVTPDRMWIEIDGKKTFETTDKRFIPTGAGFFTVGKALTHRRDAAGRTDDGVFVDYVEIYKLNP